MRIASINAILAILARLGLAAQAPDIQKQMEKLARRCFVWVIDGICRPGLLHGVEKPGLLGALPI